MHYLFFTLFHCTVSVCFALNDDLSDGTKSVLEMAADGNCLFRSLSDQLYNDFGDHHVDVRDDVVDYMEQHKDDFVVFLVLDDKDCNDEDATDFESYCNDMRNDGTWGGNLELVAASKFYRYVFLYLIIFFH